MSRIPAIGRFCRKALLAGDPKLVRAEESVLHPLKHNGLADATETSVLRIMIMLGDVTTDGPYLIL